MRFNFRYTVPKVKQSPTVMVQGCIAATGRGGLWIMPKNSTIKAATISCSVFWLFSKFALVSRLFIWTFSRWFQIWSQFCCILKKTTNFFDLKIWIFLNDDMKLLNDNISAHYSSLISRHKMARSYWLAEIQAFVAVISNCKYGYVWVTKGVITISSTITWKWWKWWKC